jgi:tetratricopeptide (TPR) repeat protein
MKMKPVAIVVAGIVLVLQWTYRKCDQADAKLGEFYSFVASANFSSAGESVNEAIRLWPSNARYYGWRGYVRSQQLPSQCPRRMGRVPEVLGDLEVQLAQQAAADYRRSLALNSRDAVAHHNLAWLEHLFGDDTAAAIDWRQSVEIDPDNSVFRLSYAMFLEENGDVRTAREQYESAVEMTPSILDSPFFARYRSRFPVAADFLVKDCAARIKSRLGQGNNPILEARLGKLYLYLGDLEQSAPLLEDAARQLPNLPLVWFNLGELRQSQGNIEQALICYKRTQAIDASLAGPYLRMGDLDLRAGRTDVAAQELTLALKRWQTVKPVTAAHNNRLYRGPRQTIDDLLPTTLVWFISPCEASAAWSELSRLHPENADYGRRVRTCEQIPAPHAAIQ